MNPDSVSEEPGIRRKLFVKKRPRLFKAPSAKKKKSWLEITAPAVWPTEELRRMLPRVHKWADVEDDCPVLVKRARDSVTIDLEDVKVSESAAQSAEPAEKEVPEKEYNDVVGLPILDLSDEVLTLIFRRFTPKQHVPLTLTCERFHTLIRDLGCNHFASMRVDWTNLAQTVSGIIGERVYTFVGDTSVQQITTTGARVFRMAMVEALTVEFSNCSSEEREFPYSNIVADLLKKALYKSVQVHFNCDKDYSAMFFKLFIRLRALKDVNVGMSWARNCTHDIAKAQRLLSVLPRMDKLKLAWQLTDGRLSAYTSITPDQCLINDALLARLVAHVTEADLIAYGNYTAKGVMAAFEMVCRSKVKRKSLAIYVKNDIIDEIFSTEYDNFQANIHQGVVKYLYDAERKAVLTASFSKIWMQKRWTS